MKRRSPIKLNLISVKGEDHCPMIRRLYCLRSSDTLLHFYLLNTNLFNKEQKKTSLHGLGRFSKTN